jgi:hypothetical protein
MNQNKKKKLMIPKVKKKIKWFLTDESWKITKQAALWLTAWTFFALWLEDTAAAWGWTGHSSYSHGNTLSCWSPSHTSNLGHANTTWWCSSWSRSGHTSGWAVLWHGNATGHSSHGSHSSHADFCFTADQLVSTIIGLKPISEIKVWDEIISYSETNNEYTTSIVDYCIVHDWKMYNKADFSKRCLLSIGIEIESEIVYTKATENHPYYDIVNDTYKKIREFNVWDRIKTIKGEWRLVSKEIIFEDNDSIEAQNTIVYNLHMKEWMNHNYFVNSALVHNSMAKP